MIRIAVVVAVLNQHFCVSQQVYWDYTARFEMQNLWTRPRSRCVYINNADAVLQLEYKYALPLGTCSHPLCTVTVPCTCTLRSPLRLLSVL